MPTRFNTLCRRNCHLSSIFASWTIITFSLLVLSANAQYKMRNSVEYYLPENWPAYELKLSDLGNFIDIFKAGLQPNYVPSMEDTFVEIKHAKISIEQSNGQTLPEFEVEYSEVRPLADGTLYKMIFVSQPLTINQAGLVAKKWLPYVSKGDEELRQFLNAVKADPVRYSDANFGAAPEGFSGGWTGREGERFSVWFRQNYNVQVPLRFCLRINYRKARTLKEFTAPIDSPIEAPEGYTIRKIKNFGPDDTAEMMYAKGIPFLEGRGLSGINQNEATEKKEEDSWGGHLWGNRNNTTERSISNKNLEGVNPPSPQENASHLRWIISGVMLAGILILIFKIFRGKVTS